MTPKLYLGNFMHSVLAEVERAEKKFPDPAGLMCALTEEVGELAKAIMDEPEQNVYLEAVQVAAMACRIAMEGDPTLNPLRISRRQKPLESIK